MRTFLRLLCPMVLLVALSLSTATPALAQGDTEPEPTEAPIEISEPVVDPDSPVGRIIPQPNSGTRPRSASDRGGALQLSLLGLIVLFPGIAVWRVWSAGREGRRRDAAQLDAAASPRTRDRSD